LENEDSFNATTRRWKLVPGYSMALTTIKTSFYLILGEPQSFAIEWYKIKTLIGKGTRNILANVGLKGRRAL
jgi:hypothetical protein